jgi:hypothetical protein
MELRNIHFAAEETSEPVAAVYDRRSDPTTEKPENIKLRLRKTKVSPLEEYALRPGQARPISDSLASLICCRKGRAEIGPKGITVERKDIGGKRIYHHVDSILCNDLSQRERKIFYVLNSLKPEIIHLLDETGRYIESLPEKFQPGVLNNEEQKREWDDQKRQLNRVARHLQELHGEDTKEAFAALTHNASVMKGIVQVLGSGAADAMQEPAPSPLGERIAQVERDHSLRTSRQQAAGTASDIVRRRTREVECPF